MIIQFQVPVSNVVPRAMLVADLWEYTYATESKVLVKANATFVGKCDAGIGRAVFQAP
ncbi:hypothetical protein Q095_04696 [Pseudomonas aeruginosa PS50]|nr:hypothetical protein Q095_04696 [Pseudomonas aeruginosa PS50]